MLGLKKRGINSFIKKIKKDKKGLTIVIILLIVYYRLNLRCREAVEPSGRERNHDVCP
jgi:hypothetical protein